MPAPTAGDLLPWAGWSVPWEVCWGRMWGSGGCGGCAGTCPAATWSVGTERRVTCAVGFKWSVLNSYRRLLVCSVCFNFGPGVGGAEESCRQGLSGRLCLFISLAVFSGCRPHPQSSCQHLDARRAQLTPATPFAGSIRHECPQPLVLPEVTAAVGWRFRRCRGPSRLFR